MMSPQNPSFSEGSRGATVQRMVAKTGTLQVAAGRELAVEIDGEGPALLMIGGLGYSSSGFQLQADALADRQRVIRPDLVGQGRTPLQGTPSVASHAADMIALLDALGESRTVVVGQSLGTLIAREMAARNPERVAGLVLLGAVAPPDDGGAMLRARAEGLRHDGVGAVAPTIARASLADRTRTERPHAAALVRALLMSQDAEGYAANYEALAGATDPGPVDPRFPTLLVVGEEDRIGPPEVSRGIAAAHGSAQLVELPACGHWPMVEAPEATLEHLEPFLAALKGGAAWPLPAGPA